MELKDERELEVTREKLRSLEARYQSVSQDPGDDAHIQELTLQSLKRMINQMNDEIARYESRRLPRPRKPGAFANNAASRRLPTAQSAGPTSLVQAACRAAHRYAE